MGFLIQHKLPPDIWNNPSPMQRLRNARLLVQFLLAWWILAMGVAIAAPLVHAQPLEMVCSVGGNMKWVAISDEGQNNDSSPTFSSGKMDCPLCMTVVPPPDPTAHTPATQIGLSYALRPIPAAHIAARTAAPLPARGPPTPL
jgi:hypothetical protein